MKCDVITIFPEIFDAYLREGIMKRALMHGILEVSVHNLRDYTTDRHRTVDDYPYGGGAGMVMKPEPFFSAVESLCPDRTRRRVILLSPAGKRFDHQKAIELSRESRRIIFLCGRYEAIDERVRISLADEEISTGDYVLTGGELPALVIIDAAARLLPGALGDEQSAVEDSFSEGILDYPHYTRPPVFRDMAVPEVLLSGNHKDIQRWRRTQALRRTAARRPDLLSEYAPRDEDEKLLREIKEDLS